MIHVLNGEEQAEKPSPAKRARRGHSDVEKAAKILYNVSEKSESAGLP